MESGNRKAEILTLLRESGDYVSGPQDILSGEEIASRLHTKWLGQNLYYLDETGSTNTDAKRLGEEGKPHGTVVVADRQMSGKGRRGRGWQSPSGVAVYFTILLRPDFAPDRASMITLVMALSVVEAVEEMAGVKAQIKWPNDIVVNNRKVCGILTEMSVTSEINEIQFVVVGAGINVNNRTEDFPEEISGNATSLLQETGRELNRSVLLAQVLAAFEKNYETFEKTLDMSGLHTAYQERLINVGRKVRVLDPAEEYEGISRGINEMGELIVEKDSGESVTVYAGEVSVRGLYGYV